MKCCVLLFAPVEPLSILTLKRNEKNNIKIKRVFYLSA